MLTITFTNYSKTFQIADYEYEVFVNGDRIAKGLVKGHDRDNGWEGLVAMFNYELEKKLLYYHSHPLPFDLKGE